MFQEGIVIALSAILFSLFVVGYLIYRATKKSFSPTSNYAVDLLPHDSYFITKAIIFSLYIAATTSTFLVFFTSFNTVMATTGGIILAISSLMYLFLPYFKSNKSMSYYSILYFSMCAFGSVIAGLGGILENRIAGYFDYPLWLGVIFLIIGVIEFGILFIPTLWSPKFVEKAEENGKTIFVRPRFSTLALYQWIYPAISIIQIILIFITSFFLSI